MSPDQRTWLRASGALQDAANHFIIAYWVTGEYDPAWHAAEAMKKLHEAAELFGFKLVQIEPAVHDQSVTATREQLRALAEAGYAPVSEYVAAVTEKPGFDGRALTAREKFEIEQFTGMKPEDYSDNSLGMTADGINEV